MPADMPSIAINPSQCPLCGQDNRCAMELERRSGQPQPPCWCTQQDMHPDALARLPPQARNLACLCQRCATSPTHLPKD